MRVSCWWRLKLCICLFIYLFFANLLTKKPNCRLEGNQATRQRPRDYQTPTMQDSRLRYCISAEIWPEGKSGYFFSTVPKKVEQHSICFPELACILLNMITHTHKLVKQCRNSFMKPNTIRELVKPSIQYRDRQRRRREPISNDEKEIPTIMGGRSKNWLYTKNIQAHTIQ